MPAQPPKVPLSVVSDDVAPAAFTVAVTYASGPPTVLVEGEVDIDTAPHLAAILHTVTDPGPSRVVLDLGAVGFLGAAGLNVIAQVAARLAPAGGRLVLRSPSRQARWLLDICALTRAVDLEDRPLSSPMAPPAGMSLAGGGGHLGVEQPRSGAGAQPQDTIDPSLISHLRQVTAIPANHDVVDGALRLVVALALAAVERADGVSVSLARHGRLSTVAASDQTITDMDTDQYATGEGPCVDASVHGRWFHAEELDRETRWPAFAPKALGLGINSILSSPLLAGGRPAGALNMYSRTPQAFARHEQQLAETFAVEASRILTEAGAGFTDDEASAQFDEALLARTIIAQAQGILMSRGGSTADQAFTILRRLSVSTDRPLASVAAHLVASLGPAPEVG